MKPVLYRYKDTESVIKVMDGYTPGEGWTPLYDNPQPERKQVTCCAACGWESSFTSPTYYDQSPPRNQAMTTITMEKHILKRLDALEDFAKEIRAALAAPATAPEQMPLERDCICHQYLHLDAYSGGAAPEGLHGALWVVVEGVRKKYVLADQSSEPKDMPALATTPKQPRPFVPWSKEAEMLESWAAQSATAPAQPEIVDLLAEMYELILANKVVLAEKSGGVWTWPDRAIEAVRKHRSGPARAQADHKKSV